MGRYYVKQIVCVLIFAAFAAGGCAPIKKTVRTSRALRYETILVMPFIGGTDEERRWAHRMFYDKLRRYWEVRVVNWKLVDQDFMASLDLDHPESMGALDFTMTPEGKSRLGRIRAGFNADAIVFGTVIRNDDNLTLAIQMLDAERGALSISFVNEAQARPRRSKSTIYRLAKAGAVRVMNHIRQNITSTHIYKYE